MKIKLGDRFKDTKNYDKIMDAEYNDNFVVVRLDGEELKYPKYEFEKRLKNGMFIEVSK